MPEQISSDDQFEPAFPTVLIGDMIYCLRNKSKHYIRIGMTQNLESLVALCCNYSLRFSDETYDLWAFRMLSGGPKYDGVYQSLKKQMHGSDGSDGFNASDRSNPYKLFKNYLCEPDARSSDDRVYYGKSYYDKPYYDKPCYDKPHYDKPHYDKPHYDKPHYDKPHYDKLYYDKPHYDKLYYDRPSYGSSSHGSSDLRPSDAWSSYARPSDDSPSDDESSNYSSHGSYYRLSNVKHDINEIINQIRATEQVMLIESQSCSTNGQFYATDRRS
jgi:hypothetical protein